MDKKPIWEYIQIGTDLRYLQDCDISYPIKIKDGVVDNIKRLLRDMEELGLFVTIKSATDLVEFKTKLEKVDPDRNLAIDEVNELFKILEFVRHTMEAEAGSKFAFFTTDKRYEVNRLLNEVGKLFSPKVYANLPVMAQFDFSEAGKCIAFERATSAAFHILRGTEVLVRLYYKKYLRKDPTGKTWGQLLAELKNKNSGKKPNTVTINHLINIKDSFRNPTQHPDKRYDIYEAQDLLGLCIDVVNKMATELN